MSKRRIVLVRGLLLLFLWVATAILIWFVGPLFAFADWVPLETESARLWCIAGVLVAYLGMLLGRWLQARRNNIHLIMEMLANARERNAEAGQRTEDVAELQRRFQEAMQILKRSPLGKGSGKRYVYQLPWYVVLGAPGAGKTTALMNSGLQFPLASRLGKTEIGGIGGTRYCDWWFTDEAVLIDTAGRYTTQDSNTSVDQAGWHGFLGLLKKYRRRQPLNGVILALSLGDIVQADDTKLRTHAEVVRLRLQELHEQLGVQVPVYLLLTKCDLLPGFREFFVKLSQDERNQVFGTTLPHQDGGVVPDVATLQTEFMKLGRRLEERVVARLQEEQDTDQRTVLFGFPVQFHLSSQRLGEFLGHLLLPTRFENQIFLRGVYWTSAIQEGTPMDRIVGAMAGSYGVPLHLLVHSTVKSKTYFLTSLLREVIFQEAGLVGFDPASERRNTFARRAILLTLLTGAGILAAGWCLSYQRNLEYVNEVAAQIPDLQTKIATFAKQGADINSALPVLRTLRHLAYGDELTERRDSMLQRLGLSQREKLGSEAQAVYLRSLQSFFLPGLAQRLEAQLRSSNDPDFSYEGLRVYLMLFDAGHLDRVTVQAWFDLDWERNLPRDAYEQRRQLQANLSTALAEPGLSMPIHRDEALISLVRKRIGGMPVAQRIYQRLQRSPAAQSVPEFRVSEAAGREAPLVLRRHSGASLASGVPGFYTHAGYEKVLQRDIIRSVARFAEDHWLYGTQETGDGPAFGEQQLEQQVRHYYFDDYRKVWEQLLADVDIVEFHTAEDGARILNILSTSESPLRQFLNAVRKETTFAGEANAASLPATSTSRLPALTEQAVSDAAQRLRSVITVAPVAAHVLDAQSLNSRLETELSAHFDPLHQLLGGDGTGGTAPLDATQRLFGELAMYMNGVASAGKRNEPATVVQGSEVLGRMRMEAQRLPAPLGTIMRVVAARSTDLGRSADRHRLNSLWGASVEPFCQHGIAGRYPLFRSGAKDVTLADFGRFFGPGGLMDDFFQKNLKAYVDASSTVWHWYQSGTGPSGMATETLKQFQRSASIKDAFFAGGDQRPNVSFELKPVRMDASITHLTLELDGQVLKYSHGPIVTTPMHWSGEERGKGARLQIAPPGLTGRSSISETGPWAWFRLLDHAQIVVDGAPERFKLTFNIDGRSVSFELHASSVLNPFRLAALEEFQCPANL